MLNVIMMNVVRLSVVMLCVIKLSVVCWVSLCWVSLCWVSIWLCWVSRHPIDHGLGSVGASSRRAGIAKLLKVEAEEFFQIMISFFRFFDRWLKRALPCINYKRPPGAVTFVRLDRWPSWLFLKQIFAWLEFFVKRVKSTFEAIHFWFDPVWI
jgi:hypothetical protein